jgi:hypothetical protein
MAVATRWLDSVPDALTAEVMAAKKSLLAVERGFGKAILEIDCSALKSVLESAGGIEIADRRALFRYHRVRLEF